MQGRISMSLITSITLVRLVAECLVQEIKARRFGSRRDRILFRHYQWTRRPPSALRARFLDDGSVALEESIMVRSTPSPMEGLEC